MNERHGFHYIYKDKGGDRTILLLHGTGADEHDLLPLGEAIDKKANLLSPRGPVKEQGMARFFRRSPAGEFDLEDMRKRAEQLSAFLQETSRVHSFSLDSLVSVGFSNGATMASALLMLFPEFMRGALLFCPALPFGEKELSSWSMKNDLSGKEVCLFGGTHDTMIDPEHSRLLAELLERRGARVDLHMSPHGHEISEEDLKNAGSWYTDHIHKNA